MPSAVRLQPSPPPHPQLPLSSARRTHGHTEYHNTAQTTRSEQSTPPAAPRNEEYLRVLRTVIKYRYLVLYIISWHIHCTCWKQRKTEKLKPLEGRFDTKQNTQHTHGQNRGFSSRAISRARMGARATTRELRQQQHCVEVSRLKLAAVAATADTGLHRHMRVISHDSYQVCIAYSGMYCVLFRQAGISQQKKRRDMYLMIPTRTDRRKLFGYHYSSTHETHRR